MQTLDIFILILLGYGLVRGLFKGLFVEIASLLSLILGIYGAIHFSDYVGTYLNEAVNWNKSAVSLTSFVLTFAIIVIVITLLGKFFTKIADFAALGILNKLFGGIFGMLKMALIASVLLIFFHKINSNLTMVKEETLQESKLYFPVKELAVILFPSYFDKKNETPSESNSLI